MTQRGIPADVVRAWTAGARRDRAVRRDVERYVRDTPKDAMARIAERLARFDRPADVVRLVREMTVATGPQAGTR